MIKNIISGRLFGHPIHIMLVHFPIAFFPMSFVLDVLSFLFKDIHLEIYSFYSACAGAVLGWIAAIFGAIDLLKIQSGNKVFFIALLHGCINVIVLIIFTVIIILQFKYYPSLGFPSMGLMAIKFLAIAGIIYTNYLGGELILKYHIGEKK